MTDVNKMTIYCTRCGRMYDPTKPHDCADRTAFTHGMEHFYDPAVIPTAVPDGHTVIDGKLWRVIPSGFGYDDGSQSCRLVPTEVAQDQVEHENVADPTCSCENPKPGAHAQSCPRFGMNP